MNASAAGGGLAPGPARGELGPGVGGALTSGLGGELAPSAARGELSASTARGELASGTARGEPVEPRAGAADGPSSGRAGTATGGKVVLVGAGPGDPELLTVRAARLLASCDVVAYDELVPPALLAVARPEAERLPVGRRCHGRSRAPMRLHPDVLARAREGKLVVRLKAGDPFVFGRGGEEVEELALAQIPFEVVPGVSAALGAASAAWIPLTHREVASDVTFATGHDLTHAALPGKSHWAKLAGSGTLVLYMASRSLEGNLARLAEHGRAAATPAAWIAAATRAEQRVVVGTVGDLAARVGPQGDAPALVIVGEVVRIRERLLALAAAHAGPGGEGAREPSRTVGAA